MQFDILYKMDIRKKLRFWEIAVEGDSYFVTHGLVGTRGLRLPSVRCRAKNKGRINETSAEEQAKTEAKALWAQKKLDGYSDNPSKIRSSKIPKPMLAQPFQKASAKIAAAFANHKFVYCQPKLDGVRCLATKEGLFTRQGRPIKSCPHIERDLMAFFATNPKAVLDGELYNHDMRNDFNSIVGIVRTEKASALHSKTAESVIQYHIYDFISQHDFSWRHNAAANAVRIASASPSAHSLRLVKSETVNEQMLKQCRHQHLQDGYEGTMVRLPEHGYEAKRSWSLIKCKMFEDAEFKILRVEEGKGTWAGAAKRIVCITDNGLEFGAGLKGNRQHAEQIIEQADEFIGGEATIRFQELSPDGIPRFPVAIAVYKEARCL